MFGHLIFLLKRPRALSGNHVIVDLDVLSFQYLYFFSADGPVDTVACSN